MSKECPGKYHGSAVKYINDDEKFCLICQQEMALKKQKTKEIWAGIGKGVVAVGGIALTIAKIFGGGKNGGNDQA